ncbi:hypothetical protein CEXT_32981 [Caerostris extrusa]|uniref:Uncharacterized protein n=1 Tax=Caerostris extrusa TaxID=172846 RepID=A0AAV4SVP7_CAEEX|nr:hypothetical protein CEXT_32981 [Caerostris extrusa]
MSGKKFFLPALRVAEMLFASPESFKQPSLIFGSRFGLPTVLELTSAITYQRGLFQTQNKWKRSSYFRPYASPSCYLPVWKASSSHHSYLAPASVFQLF